MTNGRWRSSLAALLALSLAAVGAGAPAAAADEPTSLTDTFDTLGSQWYVAAGDWAAVDGAARVVTPGTPRGSALALTGYRLEPVSTATAEFQTEGGGATAWAGFTVNRVNIDDDYTESGYTVLLRNSGELAVIAAAGSGGVRYLGTAATSARPGTAPVTLTVRLDGDTLAVDVDGAETLSVTDGAFTAGGFTLAAHRDLKMIVDSVALDGVVARPEPTPVPPDCVAWSGTPSATTARGTVLNSPERMAAVARRVADGVEPQAAAYDRLLDEVAADLERTPAPPTTFFVPFFYNNPDAHRAARDGLQNDADAAYRLALAYRISGDEVYGQHATRFLDAWTSTVECVRTSEDSALAFSYHFPAFIHAAELLRGTPVWSSESEALFAGFVAETAVPVAESIMFRENNWGSWALETKAAAAAYLDDAELLAASYARGTALLDHQIDADGHMPEEVTRNNGVGDYGIWYTHFSLLPLMLVSETLSAHGYDLYSYENPLGVGLADAVAAVSGWVDDPSTFPYYSGDPSGLANVRTIDYLRATGVIAHSMSYFELAADHYPSAVLAKLLAEEGPMTTIHAAPFLSLTHGSMAVPDPEPVVDVVLESQCVPAITILRARVTNIVEGPVAVSISAGDRTTGVERLAPGESTSVTAPTSATAGEIVVTATDESGQVQTRTVSFDESTCSPMPQG